MASFMLNKVILIGNVGGDPDVRTMPNGSRVANFSLATTEYWTDKSGQRQSRTEWHKVCVYAEGLVRLVEKAVHKGSKLYVEGSIKSRKYTSQQDGIERTIVEIIICITMLVEKIFFSLSLLPVPISYVMKRLIADDNAVDITANNPTIPPTT